MPTGIGINGYLGNSAEGIFFRDWQHAARLYVDDAHRLSPKPKWLFYVVFNLNSDAVGNTSFQEQNQRELNYLVKRMDLPKYTLNIENLNQYNRKTTTYTKITYEPVNLTFHDDNNGVTNALWALYYGYYFADRWNSASPYTEVNPPAYTPHAYDRKDNWQYRYGLDTKAVNPFFQSVQLLTLSKHKFTSYLLCHPKVTSWQHDTMDQSEGNGIVESTMSLAYDAVIYTTGTVSQDNPTGFASLHYDQAQSPLGPENQAVLQGAAIDDSYSLYSNNTFNPIDTSIGMLSTFRQAGYYGNNRAPYGYGQNILNYSNASPYTTSGLQNYNFSTSATLAESINSTNYKPYVTAPIDESFNNGSVARAQAINDQYSTALPGVGNSDPIISDAYYSTLPRTTLSSNESQVFSNTNTGKVLPETTGAVDMSYFTTNDIQNNAVLVNELINNNPQAADIPEDPFE
jgi:hypothetical protein